MSSATHRGATLIEKPTSYLTMVNRQQPMIRQTDLFFRLEERMAIKELINPTGLHQGRRPGR